MHAAARAGARLTTAELRRIYLDALLNEQERPVAPAIEAAIGRFDCPMLKGLEMKPMVRFEYFPRAETFWFDDFSGKDERIHYATRAFDIAAAEEWEHVIDSIRGDGVEIPSAGAAAELVERLL